MIRPTCLATKWYYPRIPRVVHISGINRDNHDVVCGAAANSNAQEGG